MGSIHFGSGLLVDGRQAKDGIEAMTVIAIFILGLFVSGLTLTAAVLVGLQEASDPVLSRVDELTEIEKKIVDR